MGTAFVSVAAGAQEQASAPAPIEVLMDGQSYPSMHAYQRDRLKSRMREALSGNSLQEFDDQELTSIMGELRREQMTSPDRSDPWAVPGSSPLSASSPKEDVLLMEEMLKGYEEKHGEAPSLIIDPGKVKTVTIP